MVTVVLITISVYLDGYKIKKEVPVPEGYWLCEKLADRANIMPPQDKALVTYSWCERK